MSNPSLAEDEHIITSTQRGLFYIHPDIPNVMASPISGFDAYGNLSTAFSSKQTSQDDMVSNFGWLSQFPLMRSTATSNLWSYGGEVKIERSMSNNDIMKRSLRYGDDDKYKHLHHRDLGVSSTTSMNMNIMKKKAKTLGRRKMREPRFSFKTMSDVDVLDDGYKWRKYGQKVVKDTHHPRSYYRCTQDNCRVKKRVERLAEDPRMVITTYEGRHMHSPTPAENDHDQTLEF